MRRALVVLLTLVALSGCATNIHNSSDRPNWPTHKVND